MYRIQFGRMSEGFTHRQVVFRLLPGRRGVWWRLERVLEAPREVRHRKVTRASLAPHPGMGYDPL